MSRKDTILIAVIINAGLLAILFATAIIYDTDKLIDQMEFDTSLAEVNQGISHDPMKLIASHQPQADEYERSASRFVDSPSSELIQEELYFQEPDIAKVGQTDYIEMKQEAPIVAKGNFVEVTVKKGDSLEKIARANGTTISAIKKANSLTHERLSIGQVLKIPLTKEYSQTEQFTSSQVSKTVNASSDVVYHTVKSGDNPWKIAKQYGVKYDDILILNKLDEDKARNLKIGDRIRVK